MGTGKMKIAAAAFAAIASAAGTDLSFTLKTSLPDGSDVRLVRSVNMRCQEKTGCITWTGHPLLGPSFKATATLKPSPGGLEWGFEYSGNDSGRLIEEVSFPEWTVPRTDKAKLLVPCYNGIVRSPDWSRFKPGQNMDRRGPCFLGFHFVAMLDERGGSRYLDQRGDARMHATRFEVDQGPRPGTCVLKSVHEMPLSPETSKAYRIPYTGTMTSFAGGWFDAACIYREWVRTQDWYKRAAARDFSKLKDVSLWMWNRGRSSVTVPPALKFMKDTGLKCALDWYWWHEIPYDTCYPAFWPPREPEADFRAAVKSIHDAGGYVQPYTNGMLWDCDDARWAEGGEDCTIMTRDGKPKATMFNPYTKQRQAWMCGEAPRFQEKMRALERTIRDTGMDGVYMDMIASAAFGGCHNPRHRHPRGGGRHVVDGYRAFVEKVRADNPGFYLSSEEQTEAYLDLFESLIYVYPSYERFGRGVMPEVELVPASLAIFHGAAVCFGSFAIPDLLPAWDEKWGPNPHPPSKEELEKKFPDQFAVEFSRGVTWGLQPTVHKFLLSHATDARFKEDYDFIKDTARFYHDNRDLLFDGEMLDPGTLHCDCRSVEFLQSSSYTRPEHVKTAREPALPVIFRSAWRSKAGKCGAVLVNWSRAEQPYVYMHDTQKFTGRLAPRSWLRLDLDAKKASETVVDGVRQIEVRVRQTPGGPRLFVDGQRHLPRSVMVGAGSRPCEVDVEWAAYDLPFRPSADLDIACIHLRFEKKSYYGGVSKPDGWVRFKDIKITDDLGRVVAAEGSFASSNAFRKGWTIHDGGTTGKVSFEPGGVLKVDVFKDPKVKKDAGWSLNMRGSDFHLYSRAFKVEKGRRYHLVFEAKADRKQPISPCVYQVPGFVAATFEQNPFDDQVRLASKAGIDIVIPNASGPTWTLEGTLSFKKVDSMFDRVLAINPYALVMARFNVTPSLAMLRDNPDWRMRFADGSDFDMASVSCRPAWRVAAYMIEETARHLMARYPRNFIGMHLAAHRAGEWLYEDLLKGALSGYDVHTRDAWRAYLARLGRPDASTAEVPSAELRSAEDDKEVVFDPVKEARAVDFQRFLNEEMAGCIAELAAVARKATQGKKLVMFFYGYSFEVASSGANSGHFALDWLLDRAAGNIDILCGPFSYGDRRWPDTRPVMAPSDTLRRHGVMWWNEDDTRTYLETNIDALQIQGKVPLTKPQTLATLARNNLQNADRGDGSWWMDLRGRGWFIDPDLWHLMEETRAYETERMLSDVPFAPDVAVTVSEDSVITRRRSGSTLGYKVVSGNARELERCCIPFGRYLMADMLRADIPARVQFHLTPWYLSSADRSTLRAQRTRRPDLVRVWLWAPGYLNEKGKSDSNITDATGFKVRRTSDPDYAYARPLFAVDPAQGDEVWARYKDGSAAVVVRRLPGGGAEVFHGPPELKAETIRRIVGLGAR